MPMRMNLVTIVGQRGGKNQKKNGNTKTARLQKMKNAKWKPVEDSSVIDKRSFAAQIYLRHKRCGLSQL